MTTRASLVSLLAGLLLIGVVLYWAVFRQQSEEPHIQLKMQADQDRPLTLERACDVLFRDLKVTPTSRLGKKLIERDLAHDEEHPGLYWIRGELDMNLSEMRFRIYTNVESPFHSPWMLGKFYYDDNGELQAKVVSD